MTDLSPKTKTTKVRRAVTTGGWAVLAFDVGTWVHVAAWESAGVLFVAGALLLLGRPRK